MKAAQFLTKHHRKDIWTDGSGDIWFFDGVKHRWRLIICGAGQPILISEENGDFKPTNEFGPFTRLWKTPR